MQIKLNKVTLPVNTSVDIARPWMGALWKIFAFLCYAALNTLARFLSGGAEGHLSQPLPVNTIIFFQDLFALILVSPWLMRQIRPWKTPNYLYLHLTRVIMSAAAIISWYFALFFLPQADAVALSIIGPLFGVVGAKWYLKEQLSRNRISAILIAFFGACFFISPFSALSDHITNYAGLLCVLLSSLSFATAKILTRKLAALGESRQLLTGYLLLFIVPITFVPALFVWVLPQPEHWLWLLLAGFLTALAIYAVSSALSYAQVSFLSPFDIIQFILNASIGYFAFTELPATWALGLVSLSLLIGMMSMKFKT